MLRRSKSVRRYYLFAGFVGMALGVPVFAVTPSLVADINPGFQSEGSSPRGFVVIGGRVVFAAGQEETLWSTAGAPGDPVALSSTNLRRGAPLALAGDRGYFTGCDDFTCGLWTTDGRPVGTRQLLAFLNVSDDPVTAIAPPGLSRTLVNFSLNFVPVIWRTDGTAAGSGRVATPQRPRDLVSFQGKGWFFADSVNAPGALFSTNGLPGGTRRVGNVTHGSHLTSLGNRLVFLSRRELWSSDGTPAGTRRLAGVPDDVFSIATVGSRAFLFALDSASPRRELWTTDGTSSGTRRLLQDVRVSTNQLLAVGGRVAFFSSRGTQGVELWSSDGTTAGTRVIKDICPGPCSGALRFDAPAVALSALGRIWFSGYTPTLGSELWTSDLTPSGTRLVRETCPGTCGGKPGGFLAGGNRMYFTAIEDKRSVWVSDGTAGGTFPLTSEHPTEALEGARLDGSRIAFGGFDVEHGLEPWVSDGTVAGSRRLVDLESDNQAGSKIESLMSAGGRAFFFADDGTAGRELWVSDGTEAETRLVDDLSPGSASSRLSRFTSSEAGGRLVLFAQEGADSRLIGSDGTPAGTNSLLPADVRVFAAHLRAGNRLFFLAADPVHQQELWVTNGTPGGTARLTAFESPFPFRTGEGPAIFFALGDRVIVPVLATNSDEELWTSDGTPGGTQPLHQIYPFLEAPFERALSQPTQLGGLWYFVVADANSASLWRTDLTLGGTRAIDTLDLSALAGRWDLYPLDDQMILFGPGGIWASDGTALGTRIVRLVSANRDIRPVAFAGRLWFVEGGSSNRELWTTDGTAAGTAPFFGSSGSAPNLINLQVVGSRLVMATDDRSRPFWTSDGTVAGTAPLEMSGRFPFPSFFGSLPTLGVGGQLFFPWDDIATGTELWVIRP
jgi:trimeric autotransporter adhesin